MFVDTWMAGGLGRAQGGYDEMVFRAMVRDNVPFYDPLGLVSEGTKVDFQTQVNSYLYGTRFMTWLARRYSPEQLIEWTARRDGSRAYYARQFRQVFGVPMEEAWKAWDADEHAFQQKNLDDDPEVSGHALPGRHLARARIRVAGLLRSGVRIDLRRHQLSRRRRARRPDRRGNRRASSGWWTSRVRSSTPSPRSSGTRSIATSTTRPTTARTATWCVSTR